MSNVVSTSLVVSFTQASGAGTGGSLTAEIDSRPDGLNNGVTQFLPGDSPAFLVHKSEGVSIDEMLASEGTIESLGPITMTIEEDVMFTKSNQGRLNKPASGGITVMRQTPGSPAIQTLGQNLVTTSDNSVVLAVYHVRYSSQADAYRLVGASGTVTAVVYIAGSY